MGLHKEKNRPHMGGTIFPLYKETISRFLSSKDLIN
jgi:hypothetical protein